MVLTNRLEDVVFPVYPVFEEITQDLRRSGAVHTLMSGSGSTVFGTYRDRSAAELAGTSLSARWRVRIVEPRATGIGLL
jgi:4-diphosphocytidyl-2-C-methyl-D-erythritol kinase